MTAKTEKYVYVTYIRTTPQKLWDALTQKEFQKKYWFDMHQDSDWKAGAKWSMHFSDGRTADAGEILEAAPPHRAVIKWRNEFRPELADEGFSRCTYEIAQEGELCKLTVLHEIEAKAPSKFIAAVSGGWPKILSSLKTFLETGAPLPRPAG
jgi:uncharacterized protein YndB with AHSA1/START domain